MQRLAAEHPAEFEVMLHHIMAVSSISATALLANLARTCKAVLAVIRRNDLDHILFGMKLMRLKFPNSAEGLQRYLQRYSSEDELLCKKEFLRQEWLYWKKQRCRIPWAFIPASYPVGRYVYKLQDGFFGITGYCWRCWSRFSPRVSTAGLAQWRTCDACHKEEVRTFQVDDYGLIPKPQQKKRKRE